MKPFFSQLNSMFFSALVLCLGSINSLAGSLDVRDEEKIYNVLEKAKAAIVQDDAESLKLVASNSSFGYYARIRLLALNSTWNKLKTARLIDLHNSILVRHIYTRNELEKSSGEQIFTRFLGLGLIVEVPFLHWTAGKVNFDSDTSAHASAKLNGRATGFDFRFSKDNDTWKIDFSSFNELSSQGIKKLASKSELSDNKSYLISVDISENVTGNDIGELLYTYDEK